MSTITRERAQEIFLGNGPEPTASEERELARIALASLEADPVAYIIQDADARSRGEKGILRYFANISDEDINEYQITVTPLYTAPQAPVSVPDEREAFNAWNNDTDCPLAGRDAKTAACLAWCRRAAMLQGAENAETPTTMQTAPALDSSPKIAESTSGNSPVIQDGSEDTKRLDWLDAQNKRLNEYYGTTYGWKFDANFQRNAMMLNDSNYPVMTVRQDIDEAIAAAPQQEVDNG